MGYEIDRLIAKKKQIIVIFERMAISQAGEYPEILGLSEESNNYKINFFMSKWGYMREQAFLTLLEQYREELL